MPSPDAEIPEKIWNWGIVGTGRIASKFADDLNHVPGARKSAIFSRTAEKASVFADRHGFTHAFDDLAAFVSSEDVDVVYIATPHTAHMEQARAAINAGKPVLIEKPIAMQADDVSALMELASSKNIFVMEAMWSRFLPAIQRAKALIDAGRIGQIEHAEVSLFYERTFDPHDRLFDPELGGGVLHDLGVYPISIAACLIGNPELVSGSWHAAPNGVDIRASFEMKCGNVPVHVDVGFGKERNNTFDLFGSRGTLRIDRHFLKSESLTLWDQKQTALPAATGGFGIRLRNRLGLHGGTRERFAFEGTGLHFQASAVQAALGQGLKHHPVMPLSDSRATLAIIEEILKHPAT